MMFFQVPMLAVVILQLTFLVGWGFDYSRTADKGSEIETIIHRIPKIELHAHLHGSVRHSTLLELINQQNLSIEISKVRLDENDVGVRDKPFELFPVVHRVVNNIEIVQRVLREMVEDYLTENTLYLEIRTSPRVLVGDGTTIGEYVRTVTELIAELNKEYAKTIVTKLILSIDRSKSLQEGRMIYELAKQYQYVGKEKVIVGMDFAGNPQGGKFEDFRQLFETIRDDGFNITVHIAEAKELSQSSGFDLEDDETSTILQFLPDRLGHFLHMKNSHFVKLSELNQREETIPPLIEICPTTSLYLLGLSSYSDHPHIRKLLKHNYPFSLNTDDSGIFSSNLTQEILHMYYGVEMRLIDVVRSLESSIEYAFLTGEEKRELQDRLWKGLTQLYSVYNRNQDLKEVFAVTNSNADEVDMSSLYTM